ncbi:MAG: polysaccharide pyruvyl transferase family protein [Candidatus Wenzhouxiangella sp. M2_3B_020]
MTKVHLDLRATSFIDQAYKRSAEEISRISGENLGNLVFRHALWQLIDDFQEYIPATYKDLLEISAEQPVEQVIVSCANWLGTKERDERANRNRATVLESIDAPICCFGLGVQAEYGATHIELGKESRRLVEVMSGKAAKISVRDELTANTLNAMGVSNVVITGCPSNFLNLESNLGAQIIARSLQMIEECPPDWTAMRGVVSEFSGGHPDAIRLVRALIGFLREAPGFYVVQSPLLLEFLYGETSEIPALYAKNAAVSDEVLRRVLHKSLAAFTCMEAWLDFARTCSYAFGMRIHGTMIPIQAGVPSLLIAHDSRTSGLAEAMNVPSIEPREFSEVLEGGPSRFYECVAAGMDDYDPRRYELASTMYSFLRDNKLAPSAALYTFTGRD